MEHFTLAEFLAISIPEEFFMALFAWAILGKKDSVRFLNVVAAGLVLAISFAIIYMTAYPNLTLVSLFQVSVFILIIFYFYNLNCLEAIVSALITAIVVAVTQSASVNIGLSLSGYTFDEYSVSIALKSLFIIPEYLVLGLSSFILCRKHIKILNFKKKSLSKSSSSKVRYLVLQLTFTFLVIIINYVMFAFHKIYIETLEDKALIILNFLIIIIFTILAVKGAFKMSESIQKEEELKRELDGREIIQNIDYLCKLMDMKEYSEVESILKSMKEEVDRDMVSKDDINRGNSINK